MWNKPGARCVVCVSCLCALCLPLFPPCHLRVRTLELCGQVSPGSSRVESCGQACGPPAVWSSSVVPCRLNVCGHNVF